ncbi:hypothetical protein AB6E04_00915 [Vibrio amylolyticus]|uniref:hypothetical protein n=1 Tax=Vibrio amylolyticus TaxID=2847292 RepID=UPI00354C5ABB
MRLNNVLLLSIVVFFLAILSNTLRNIYFPELYDNESLSLVIASILLVATLIIWLLPAVIAFTRKDMENRIFIICLSLFLPLVGGFFSYFLLRKKGKNK